MLQSLLLVTVIVKMVCVCVWASITSWSGKHNGSSTTVSPLAGKLFVVIGAGGAGKAVAYGAKEKGARVVIANRTYGKLHDLPFSFFKLKRVKLSELLFRCFWQNILVKCYIWFSSFGYKISGLKYLTQLFFFRFYFSWYLDNDFKKTWI